MNAIEARMARIWTKVGSNLLPFADAVSADLPWSRLLRLSLFQISCGMTAVLLIGTLNRVMIVELHVAAGLVATMLALPLVFAPLRALIGFRSDTYRSLLGWRRVPYIWFGSIWQFGGLAMMPFALIVLSGDTWAPPWAGQVAAAISFLMVGAGMHTVQTVGLALATDLAPRRSQPNVVAVLSLMLLVGMVISALLLGAFLADFTQLKLIQAIQGCAAATLILNFIAMWKQEARDPSRTQGKQEGDPGFIESFRLLCASGPWNRRLLAAGLGFAGFAMQDVLLEPYGGQILGLGVGATTGLTALLAGGSALGFVAGARWLSQGADAHRLAAYGALMGIFAFGLVILSGLVVYAPIFALGSLCIGLGGGLFAHATLTSCMRLAPPHQIGLALGVWGAVQATAAGTAIALGGIVRDVIGGLAEQGALGEAMTSPATGYVVVYAVEIALLFVTLAVVGPLVRGTGATRSRPQHEPGAAGPAHV
ncbi:PucC family protein [Falsiroseomonas oryziterrae]|uniref:PucC family protein n=1 Tax=Falsiroseomonas oryziterrae TaxID=2911368 RepID=UPI001F27F7EE|nr:PucC family protein [Roseomonas sp. NPKOSM-4]